MAVVELSKVSKSYGDTIAVRELSLRIEQGEFVALLGPSGCGKTTTLQMLAGFVEPTSGDISVGGQPMRGIPPHRRNIGVVFQSYALFPHLSVFDNVAFGLRMRNTTDADIAKRVARALDLVQLSTLDQRYPKALSGGQQQRVALARALVIEPAVLLLDEPLSNLDANLREQMRFEIREIQKRIGITTVFVTHDQNEAMAAADRLVVMSKGEIRQVGTAQEIYEAPVDRFVAEFIGQANLLRGTVVASSRTEARLALASAGEVTVPNRDRIAAGRAAALALRPEDLQLASAPQSGRNNLMGRVNRVAYLGASTNVGVRIGDLSLVIALPRGAYPIADGDDVVVHWAPTAGILLDQGDRP
jgi:putative spermidine/putrescine transport system ATP-binding protein